MVETHTTRPARQDVVQVYFKELNQYKWITLRFWDRYYHADLITYTNHYGWFCK